MSHDSLGRLGPPPPASSPGVSKSMKSNRARDTAPELFLRAALRASGLKGYRHNWIGAPGRPDVAFPTQRVAVFVHGCYWHRCPDCALPLPKRNRRFWMLKFRRNIERDRRKVATLEALGWRVLVLWECKIRDSAEGCVARVWKELSATNQTTSPVLRSTAVLAQVQDGPRQGSVSAVNRR